MITDKERLERLFDDFGIDYSVEKRLAGSAITVDDRAARTSFLGLFTCTFEFDNNGKFLILEVTE